MAQIRFHLVVLGAVALLLTGCLFGRTEIGLLGDGLSDESVKAALYDQFREWRGVRYRPGGLSKSGVDCSSFVYLTYWQRFGIELPRTTRYQSRFGRRVSQKRLRPGDLVFFKTGWFRRHVGIYLEGDRFMHVSSKKGVMQSNLDDPYWRKKYWKSVRISR